MIQIEDKIFKMLTRNGFVDVFWDELKTRRQAGEDISQRKVYEELEGLLFKAIGERRFPTWNAFRMYRNSRG